MKKIINRPEDVVRQMCQGIVLAHPELVLDAKYKVIRKKTINTNKVSLISGGGSGHEPAHAGYI
ncbi:MAG TPA: dihydroxyacetone kinase subunit DhaK, partial [Sedimentisphaerales bacterium]